MRWPGRMARRTPCLEQGGISCLTFSRPENVIHHLRWAAAQFGDDWQRQLDAGGLISGCPQSSAPGAGSCCGWHAEAIYDAQRSGAVPQLHRSVGGATRCSGQAPENEGAGGDGAGGLAEAAGGCRWAGIRMRRRAQPGRHGRHAAGLDGPSNAGALVAEAAEPA